MQQDTVSADTSADATANATADSATRRALHNCPHDSIVISLGTWEFRCFGVSNILQWCHHDVIAKFGVSEFWSFYCDVIMTSQQTSEFRSFGVSIFLSGISFWHHNTPVYLRIESSHENPKCDIMWHHHDVMEIWHHSDESSRNPNPQVLGVERLTPGVMGTRTENHFSQMGYSWLIR